LFTALTSSSPIGIYLEQDGRFQFVNPHFAAVTGYPQQELMQMDALALVHPDDRASVRKSAVEMLNGRRTAPYELRYLTKNGETRWAVATVASARYKGGLAVVGNFMDVTHQKQSDLLFSTLVNTSAVGMYIVQDRAIRFANPEFLRQMGYAVDEILGKPAMSIVHPEDAELVRTNAGQMLRGERLAPYEVRLLTRAGEVRWFVATAAPTQFEGKPAVLGTVADITDRKEADQARLLRTPELEALMNVTGLLVLPLSFDEKINKLLEEIVKIAQAHNASLRVMDEDGSSMKFIAMVGSIAPPPPELGSWTQPSANVLRAFKEARHIVVDDYAADPDATPMVRALGVRSVVVLPVMLEGRAIAVATVASKNPGHFNAARVRLVKAIADSIGALLNGIKLAELERLRAAELGQKAHELTALNQLFRKHLAERFEAADTYRNLAEQLQTLAARVEAVEANRNLAEQLQKLAANAKTLADSAGENPMAGV
jgi:PAS domain S-box-containing protein